MGLLIPTKGDIKIDNESILNSKEEDEIEINIEANANSKDKSTKNSQEAEEVIVLDKKNDIELTDDIKNSRKTRRRSSANNE